jgi:hypothetical protein
MDLTQTEDPKPNLGFVKTANQFLSNHQPPPPAVVYHYTDAFGLEGILRTGKLWATHFDFLNDTSEFRFAAETLAETLQITVQDLNFADHPVAHYISSFCEDQDLLSQWRGYTSKRQGYAIGIRSESLLKTGAIFGKVNYGPFPPVKEWLQQIMKKSAAIEKGTLNAKIFSQEIAGGFLATVLLTKNPVFQTEAEWRLVMPGVPYKDARFRVRDGHLVPYIELDLDESAIARIVQGPGGFREANRVSIKNFARTRFKDVEVVDSVIPMA